MKQFPSRWVKLHQKFSYLQIKSEIKSAGMDNVGQTDGVINDYSLTWGAKCNF